MRYRSTKERKKELEEFVYKYEKEIFDLMKADMFNDNYWREKVKCFIWTKVKIEINYSQKTYYMDIWLNLRNIYNRLFDVA